MTDWCANRLTITGEARQLERLKQMVRAKEQGLPLSFARIRPMPARYEDAATYLASSEAQAIFAHLDELAKPERMGYVREHPLIYLTAAATPPLEGWWLWNHENWGTKWDLRASEVTVEARRGRLIYSFPTASAEPAALVLYLAGLYPGLRLEHLYWISYLELAGISIYQAGARLSRSETSDDLADCARLLREHGWEDAALDCDWMAEDEIDELVEDDDRTSSRTMGAGDREPILEDDADA